MFLKIGTENPRHIIIERTTVRLIEYFKSYILNPPVYFGLRNDKDNNNDVDLSVSNEYILL